MEKKILTLCCVYDEDKILLGEIIKESKIKGMFNGFGGKVEEGETIEQAALRELKEECGIVPVDFCKRGVLTFIMEDKGNPFDHQVSIMETHVFSVTKFEGNPIESREMRPHWFLHSEIPFDKMWPDDRHWIPLLLAGKNFQGTFYLPDSKTITSFDLEEVDKIA